MRVRTSPRISHQSFHFSIATNVPPSLPPSASTLTRGGRVPPTAFRPTDDYVTVYEAVPPVMVAQAEPHAVPPVL